MCEDVAYRTDEGPKRLEESRIRFGSIQQRHAVTYRGGGVFHSIWDCLYFS